MSNEQIFEPPGSLKLQQPSEDVAVDSIRSDTIQGLIDDMLYIASGEQGDKERRTMVGLAAPQIGEMKRIILVGLESKGMGEDPGLEVFINPEIVNFSDDVLDGREGCYSTGRVCGIVSRAERIYIRAYDRGGNETKMTLEGFPARIFQHEIDHLDGIRFPDRITDDSKLHWVTIERFGEYREKWREWEVCCSRAKWNRIKNGA